MNLDDFKSSWKQRTDELASDQFPTLTADVFARAAQLEAVIRRRDWIEAGAAAAVLIFFGLTLGLGALPMVAKVGVVIILLSTLEIVVVLFWTRHRDARPRSDAPLLEFCTTETRRVERQIRLLRNVNWWYSGPILLGACVMTFGVLQSASVLPGLMYYGFLSAFGACFLVVAIIIHRMNARAAQITLVPMREKLAQLVRSLSETELDSDAQRSTTS